MASKVTTFFAGARDSSPLLLGVMPFGVIWGAVCVDAGVPEWGASAMSLIVFAGASQMVTIQLMADHASLAVVIGTALVINARMFMYSASLAPHFNGMHPLRKAGLAYGLTDQAYAMSITRFNREDAHMVDKGVYYLGSAALMWAAFNTTTVAGAYAGAFLPTGSDLGFAIPLTFIALVIPAVTDRPSLLTALVAGAVAYFADPLQYNLGLVTAAVSGITVGYLAERRQSHG